MLVGCSLPAVSCFSLLATVTASTALKLMSLQSAIKRAGRLIYLLLPLSSRLWRLARQEIYIHCSSSTSTSSLSYQIDLLSPRSTYCLSVLSCAKFACVNTNNSLWETERGSRRSWRLPLGQPEEPTPRPSVFRALFFSSRRSRATPSIMPRALGREEKASRRASLPAR